MNGAAEPATAMAEPEKQADTPEVEREPEGFGDAVQAAAFMLLLVTGVAFIGFRWERGREQAAHSFAVDLVARVAERGEHALVPIWSGWGRGPTSRTARHTFRALRGLGPLVPAGVGACRVATRFALCSGTRFHCDVSGSTPAGPVRASIGLCDAGGGTPYTFDSFDLTLPAVGADLGNRADVDISQDGLIRYGTTPLPQDAPPRRMHERAPLGPFRW